MSCAGAAAGWALPRSAQAAVRAMPSSWRSTAPRPGRPGPMSRAAAFFDLDKTLMAGSSGMPFARVAMRHRIVSRRQLLSWGVEHLRYRLRGTTDERTTEVLREVRELIAG